MIIKGRSGGAGSTEPANSEEEDGVSSNAPDEQQTGEDIEGTSLGGSSVDAGSAGGGGGGGASRWKQHQQQQLRMTIGGDKPVSGANRLAIRCVGTGAEAGDDPESGGPRKVQAVPKFLPAQKLVQVCYK